MRLRRAVLQRAHVARLHQGKPRGRRDRVPRPRAPLRRAARPRRGMSRARAGLEILAAALALGLLCDLLLRAVPWGLNLALCVAGLVAATTWLLRRRGLPVSGDGPWLALTALL